MSVSLTIPSQSTHSYALALIHCLLLVAETLLSPNEAFDAESLFPPKHIASILFHPIQGCATAIYLTLSRSMVPLVLSMPTVNVVDANLRKYTHFPFEKAHFEKSL